MNHKSAISMISIAPIVPVHQAGILIVDDRQDNLVTLEVVLAGMNCRLVRAASGQEALRKLIVENYALILMDVHRTDVDGFETAHIIRQMEGRRSVPIIFLTAVGKQEGQILRGYAAGAVDYITKPFLPEILRSKVAFFLDLYRLQQRLVLSEKSLLKTNLSLTKTINEQVDIIREVKLRRVEAEEANQAKSEFLSLMSHELRTSLNAIIGSSEIMIKGREGMPTVQQTEYLQDIYNAGGYLLSLTNDILDLPKIGAGNLEFKKRAFPGGNLVDRSLVNFKEKALQHRSKLSAEGAGAIGEICADEQRYQTNFPVIKSKHEVTIRIVAIDGHPLTLKGLESLFNVQPDFELVAVCTEGGKALECVRKHKPDIVLLDIKLPGADGLTIAREIMAESNPSRIVIYTAVIEEEQMLDAVRMGVYGIVLKEMAPQLLVQCIQKIAAGEKWIEGRSARLSLENMLRREVGAREMAGLVTQREAII
ncbi:MAG: response regulator, partial [Deltaproteobacteria bacterium]